MLSPLVEASRIKHALRTCEKIGIPVYEPLEVIEYAVRNFGSTLVVSCSFGSCSVVVLHMALKVDPNIKVVFNETGVEYPETYKYKKLLTEKWSLNLIETKPVKSFWQCVKEYGLPLIRSPGMWKKQKIKLDKPACCLYLKELPMKRLCKEQGIKASMTGLRAGESRVRMFTLGQRGQFYHTKKWGDLWKFHPIAFWTEKQVRNYLKENEIPVNEIYSKGKDRTGCMPCTGYLHWEKYLAKANPKMYRYIQKLRGVNLMDDWLTFEDRTVNMCDQSPTKISKLIEEWEGPVSTKQIELNTPTPKSKESEEKQ